MEIEKQKETSTQKLSKTSCEVPANLSREKAMSYLSTQADVRGMSLSGIPEAPVRMELYKMFMKIGASSELPSKGVNRDSYLNDFWQNFYLRNNLCPADIPFGIIITEFTRALVQGTANRKGNNQAAICQAFNNWVTTQDIRNRLYQVRDEMYPEAKPKQIAKNANPETIQDYSDGELIEKYTSISPFSGIKTVDILLKKICEEGVRRELNYKILYLLFFLAMKDLYPVTIQKLEG